MIVQSAEARDLKYILGWLRREYQAAGHGFWSNRAILRRLYKDNELRVVRVNDRAVAFHAGRYGDGITCVHPRYRRKGIGSLIAKDMLTRALIDGINVIKIECSPASSFEFWKKFGFTKTEQDFGSIHAQKLIHRDNPEFRITDKLISIAFFSEDDFYNKSYIKNAKYKEIPGESSGTFIKLKHRVVAPKNEFSGRDLFVHVTTDKETICLCKAKHDKAKSAGVQEDTTSFFIDEVITH